MSSRKLALALLAGTALTFGFFAVHGTAGAEDMKQTTTTSTGVNVDAGVAGVTTSKETNTTTSVESGNSIETQTTTTNEYNFTSYDSDKDGMLEEPEYVQYSYKVIDYNQDTKVDQDEWKYYTQVWYQPYENVKPDTTRTFVTYDVNGDGFIDVAEYQKSYDKNLYTAWDVDHDGMIEPSEYNTTVKSYVVIDKDGHYKWN